MAYNYVVTAQKPTVVTHALVCNFTSPSDRNLIIAKHTRLEVHTLTPDGLVPELDASIYGCISAMQCYRPTGSSQDVIFLLMERFKFCILAFDTEKRELHTVSNGDMKDRVGRPLESGKRGIVDPKGRMIAMALYEGSLKVLPIESGSVREAYNVPLDEFMILDLVFLHGSPRPTVCVLYEDPKQARHVKTYIIDNTERELLPGAWSCDNIELTAEILIAVPEPLGGVIILGVHCISYHNTTPSGSFKSLATTQTQICAYGKIDDDGRRWLLGDANGRLYVLKLEVSGTTVMGLQADVLGETSIANVICYLDHGVVFVGSRFGDSQLIKLKQDSDDTGSWVEVLEEYLNIGVILDMCVIDVDRQGQCQAVTCSGAFKDGTLRVVRSGIVRYKNNCKLICAKHRTRFPAPSPIVISGIHEQASIELPCIKGMWALRESDHTPYDKYLIQSFIGETRVLAIQEEELEEVEIPGFAPGQTLFARNVRGDRVLQATTAAVRLVAAGTLQCVSEWLPPAPIIVATANAEQVVLAMSGGAVALLEVEAEGLVWRSQMSLEHDVACLCLQPLAQLADEQTEAHTVPMAVEKSDVLGGRADILAVCAWGDMCVTLYSLPDLMEIVKQPLGVEVQARDVMLVTLDVTNYLLVGLGDGALILFTIENSTVTGLPTLTVRKKVVIGTHPIMLSVFRSSTRMCIFAACDRPTVVYSVGGKLVYANVDVPEVSHMTSFNSQMFPDCLAMASENELTIGTVDEIQKLHVRTIPLQESSRRIAYLAHANVFAVAATGPNRSEEGGIENKDRLILFDNPGFEELYSYELDICEEGLSLQACSFTDREQQCIVLGTAFVLPDEPEASKGRILVFEVTVDRKVTLVIDKEVKGPVFTFVPFNGKLIAGVGSKVQLYKWEDKPDAVPDLSMECAHNGHIMALCIKSRGDFILVGDIMRSVVLLQYKDSENTLEEIARDFNANSMRAVEILDDDHFLGADDFGNIFVVRRNADAPTDEDRQRLELQGEFHVGDHINVLCRGALNVQPRDSDSSANAQPGDRDSPFLPHGAVLFGCVTGMIGCVLSMTEEAYKVFASVERGLRTVVGGVGGLNQEEWRAFQNERRSAVQRNVVDGDLVETFLDLNRDQMEQVVKFVNDDLMSSGVISSAMGFDEIVKRIEEAARMH